MPAIIMMITIKPNFEKYTRKDNPVILYIRKIASATVPTPITAFPEALTTNASNRIIKIIQNIFVTTQKQTIIALASPHIHDEFLYSKYL
mgnify:FL=1